jgi:SOS-response transcriptional repressor LexA
MSEVSDRLIIARKKAGFETAADAARALGVKPSTYFSHENGSVGLRSVVASKYARKFKVSTDWLLDGRGQMSGSGPVPYEKEIAGLPLLGSIQAGHWVEIGFAQEEAEKPMVPFARDPRYPYAQQYALKVVGNSMDLDYPDGSIVTCVNFADTGLALGDALVGQILHVERHRAGGHLVEMTLKLLENRKGKFYLAPHSSDPKYQAFPVNDKTADTETIVRGMVLGGWTPRNIPTLK